MPDRTYNGPVPEVDLILEAGAVRVKKGESVPVSDAEAASLDAQGDWLAPEAPASVPAASVPDPSPAEASAPAPSS